MRRSSDRESVPVIPEGRATMERRRLLAGAAALGSVMLLSGRGSIRPARAAMPLPAIAEKDAVIGFLYGGPINDGGWNSMHHAGLDAAKKAFPAIKTIEIQNVPYSADATRALRQLVAQGANMVFTATALGDLIYPVVELSPHVAFMECGGQKTGANLGWYYLEHWLPAYVIGVAAGLMTKTNKLGYIGAFPVPTIYGAVNSFQMGARSVNPQAQTQAILTNSWFDPQAETQAGSALVQSGCDFLFGTTNDPAYLQVAERAGAWAAMGSTDCRTFGPHSYVSSVLVDWNAYYVEQIGLRLRGQWAGGQTRFLAMGSGTDRSSWGEQVPPDVASKADAVRDRIIKGFNPYVGELRDQSGAIRLTESAQMDPEALNKWDWVVPGVMGLTKG